MRRKSTSRWRGRGGKGLRVETKRFTANSFPPNLPAIKAFTSLCVFSTLPYVLHPLYGVHISTIQLYIRQVYIYGIWLTALNRLYVSNKSLVYIYFTDLYTSSSLRWNFNFRWWFCCWSACFFSLFFSLWLLGLLLTPLCCGFTL